MSPERMINTNGVDLCLQTFGRESDPPLVLIMGACSSMIRWAEDLCRQFAAGGRFVIRFDNRDTGRSSSFPPGEPPYDLNDMAEDAIGLLDELGIDKAHFLGASSGGMICQLIGIRYPERVRSLTLCISTPEIPAAAHAVDGSDTTQGQLPMPSSELIEKVKMLAAVNWTDKAAAFEAFLIEAKVMAGSAFPVDENEVRSWAPVEFERQNNIMSFRLNTPIAETRTPSWRNRLDQIKAPTLVVHGTEDPVLPYPHGVALSQEIAGARLVTLEGVGHELPRGSWPTLVTEVLAHTDAADKWQKQELK